MRFWQKTYLLTLTLFLISLNVGILTLTIYTYQKNMGVAESAAIAEQYYIAMSFERDYKMLMSSNAGASPTLLMQSYGTFYRRRGVLIAFLRADEKLYSNLPGSIQTQTNSIIHKNMDGKRYILISSDICEGEYEMTIAKDVTSFDTELRAMIYTYVMAASAISIILAVALYFILKKLSEPLNLLEKTTREIEAGDYSARVAEYGNDEFTALAKSFNLMLIKINEQMLALEREAEEKKIEARSKQMLVDNMAHELRTPLTSIRGYAEYLEKANISEQRRLTAERYIISEAERLQKISEILLDSAFIRENEVEMSEVDLAAVMENISEKLLRKAEILQVKIICEGSTMHVRGNETLLSMLFFNLVENAIKACDTNGTVRIACHSGQAIVEDNGKGMTGEQIHHITEPFYRTDQARSRAEGGAGLGLNLCSQIVHAHKAIMSFESELGKGTKVFIIFTEWQ